MVMPKYYKILFKNNLLNHQNTYEMFKLIARMSKLFTALLIMFEIST